MKKIAFLSLVALAAAACSEMPTAPAAGGRGGRVAGGDGVEGTKGGGGKNGTTLIASKTAYAVWKCIDGVATLFVEGVITVHNGGDVATEGLTVVDNLEYRRDGDNVWTQMESVVITTGELAPGQIEELQYSFPIPEWWDDATYRNSALVTITNHSGSLGVAKGPNPKSSFIAVAAANDLCEETCTLTQGYWGNHGPTPSGNNENEWAVTSLELGSVTYTDLEAQSILDASVGGNGLVALAHQLIAAKLNVANGADASAVAQAIADADALIGALVVPPVGSDVLDPSATSALTALLASYNEGAIGPGHCN